MSVRASPRSPECNIDVHPWQTKAQELEAERFAVKYLLAEKAEEVAVRIREEIQTVLSCEEPRLYFDCQIVPRYEKFSLLDSKIQRFVLVWINSIYKTGQIPEWQLNEFNTKTEGQGSARKLFVSQAALYIDSVLEEAEGIHQGVVNEIVGENYSRCIFRFPLDDNSDRLN